MSITIQYDYEQCIRCVEHLHTLQEKMHVQKKEMGELLSRGDLVEEISELNETYEQLINYFDLLVRNTADFIKATVQNIQAVDEVAAEEGM